MAVGIDKLDLYAGRHVLELADLARARGLNPNYVRNDLMCEQRSVPPPFEDPVTLAVNAACRVLGDEDRTDIELCIVASESGVDFGKPISTWVHRFCELPANCRTFEVKHACYGCTGALKMAAFWVASNVRPGKKALVINTDVSRPGLGSAIEPLGGSCAVAMLVTSDPGILEIDLDRAGYWTNEIADNMRPTAKVEIVADYVSVYSYLDALEGAFDHYQEVAGETGFDASFKKHIYHAPFPAMTLQAHRTLLAHLGETDKGAARESFDRKVADSLHFARRIGSSYGGSNFVGLLGLLQCAPDLRAGDRVSLFSYGGGCQAEFYGATIGPHGVERVRAAAIDCHLAERLPLSVSQYEEFERGRESQADCKDYRALDGTDPEIFDEAYRDRKLLILDRVEGYVRHYQWSA